MRRFAAAEYFLKIVDPLISDDDLARFPPAVFSDEGNPEIYIREGYQRLGELCKYAQRNKIKGLSDNMCQRLGRAVS